MSQRRFDTADRPRAEQARLPLVRAGEAPVPYALTARARRVVAPDGVPDLAVVGDVGPAPAPPDGPLPEDLDAIRDMRCPQARALRRAGVPVAAIAQRLDVDELVVASWVDDIGAPPTRPTADAARGVRMTAGTSGPRRAPVPADTARYERARGDAASRLRTEPSFSAGLGLVAGIADVDAHRVLLTTGEQAVAGAALRWLVAQCDADPRRISVVLRLGASVPGDLARHRWAAALDVPLERVSQSRAGGIDPDQVQAVVRVADPVVAGTLAGWRDALVAAVAAGSAAKPAVDVGS